MGASSMGVGVAFAGLRPRATVRWSRISDVLVCVKCYKMGIWNNEYFVKTRSRRDPKPYPSPSEPSEFLGSFFFCNIRAPLEGNSEA